MSPTGAAILAVSGFILLGVLALWLLNVPVWSLPLFVLFVLGGFGWVLRRRARLSQGRQKTET